MCARIKGYQDTDLQSLNNLAFTIGNNNYKSKHTFTRANTLYRFVKLFSFILLFLKYHYKGSAFFNKKHNFGLRPKYAYQ